MDQSTTIPILGQIEQLKMSKNIGSWLLSEGFSELTPVQSKLFAPAVAGQDVIGIAPTGTGKTLAFTLPIMQLLIRQGARDGTPGADHGPD